MPDTIVSYHAEDGEPARPAINVKVYAAGLTFWPPTPNAEMVARDHHVRAAYDRVQSDFWQQATEIAEQRGLGSIEQQGRSGGWLVFTDGRDPQDMTTFRTVDDPTTDEMAAEAKRVQREWLAAYRAMTEWADAWIADAPRKVAALAQQYAMDEAGEAAAQRMFAFDPVASFLFHYKWNTRGAHV